MRLATLPKNVRLTPMMQATFRLLSEGRTQVDIAEEIGVTQPAVSRRQARIKRPLPRCWTSAAAFPGIVTASASQPHPSTELHGTSPVHRDRDHGMHRGNGADQPAGGDALRSHAPDRFVSAVSALQAKEPPVEVQAFWTSMMSNHRCQVCLGFRKVAGLPCENCNGTGSEPKRPANTIKGRPGRREKPQPEDDDSEPS